MAGPPGHLVATSAESNLGFLRKRQLLNGSVLQLDEDSTDIGSAMSSDVDNDMPCSSSHSTPYCSDSEVASMDGRFKSDSCLLKQGRTVATLLKSKSRSGKFKSSLETIQGTPAGRSEHPPLFFTPPPVSACMENTDCTDAEASPVPMPKPDGFHAPPGLASPKRSRKAKAVGEQPLLATSPRRRKAKNIGPVKLVLATAPENLLDEANVLPPSPTRKARTAILDKAKLNGAPLKVQMEGHTNFTASKIVKKLLDPTQPVKKAPLLPDCDHWFEKLKPGEPVKKRVTPWLLADPLGSVVAMPR